MPSAAEYGARPRSGHPYQAQRSLGEGRERMRQGFVRTLPWMLFVGIGVGIAACSGVPRGPAASFDPAIFGHHTGMTAVRDGGDAAVRPLPRMNASEALEERAPGDMRLASANAVAATDVPTPIAPLNDEAVIEEYDPWEPFSPTTTVGRLNRRNFRPCSSSSLISLAASPSFPNEGFWTVAGITYRDATVPYRMLTSDAQEAR